MRKAPHPLRSLVRGNSLVVQRSALLHSRQRSRGPRIVGELGSYNMHCGTKKKAHKLPSHRMETVSFVAYVTVPFSPTHPANQTPSPVNSTYHTAQSLPSSCPPGHWPQSGPLPPIRCHGLCLSHNKALLGTTVRAVSPDCRLECSDLKSFRCWTGPLSRSSAQAPLPGAQIWGLEMGSGSEDNSP